MLSRGTSCTPDWFQNDPARVIHSRRIQGLTTRFSSYINKYGFTVLRALPQTFPMGWNVWIEYEKPPTGLPPVFQEGTIWKRSVTTGQSKLSTLS